MTSGGIPGGVTKPAFFGRFLSSFWGTFSRNFSTKIIAEIVKMVIFGMYTLMGIAFVIPRYHLLVKNKDRITFS